MVNRVSLIGVPTDIGAGTRGPITTQLQSLFFEAVHGKLPAYNHWLTPVA